MKLSNSIVNLLKNLWFAIKIISILCVISLGILLFLHGELTWSDTKGQLFYNFYYGISLSLVNGYFFENLDRFFPWEKNAKTRAWFGFLGSIVITMITLFVLNFILWVIIWGNDWSVLFSERNRMFYLIGLIITIIISSILHAIGFFKKIQEQKMDNQKLKEEKLHMELSALKSHLDPHFLFNSFNVLSGLIDEDKNKAQDFLTGMSKIYRYVLEKRNEDTNSIKEEIELPTGIYTFVIEDTYGDGICCDVGNGKWRLFVDGTKIKSSNGKFGYWEEYDFTVGAARLKAPAHRIDTKKGSRSKIAAQELAVKR